MALHSRSETTLTHKMAFLGISMHLFQKKILPACQECYSCCLCKVCSSLGQKKGNERAITGRKIILTCPFLVSFGFLNEKFTLNEIEESEIFWKNSN